MSKIMVVGNYGVDGKLNGQTARTRNVTNTIKKIYESNNKIVVINTNKKNIFTLFNFIINSFFAKKIIIMPAQKAVTPIINYFNAFHLLKKTTYVAIGGWIYNFVKDNNKLVKRMRKLNCTLVQLESLKNNLKSLGINSEVLPNYRIYDGKISFKNKTNKYVFYSRIREDKGVLLAISAIKQFNEINDRKIFLDIYGPIDEDFKELFFETIGISEYINYCGVLNGNNQIITTLSQYKAMLFPTYYDGEGFPGAVLEAMLAGVPVIASNWKYNAEIITNNETGYIISNKSLKDLVEKISFIEKNDEVLIRLSKNCLKAATIYTEDNAILIIEKIVGN